MTNNIEKKIEKLVEEKIIKSKEDLKDIELDKLEQLAHKIDVCPMDLIIYLTCGGNCNNCTKEYKSDCKE